MRGSIRNQRCCWGLFGTLIALIIAGPAFGFGPTPALVASWNTLPLDRTTNAWGAFSLNRKLRTDYTGPLFRGREGTTNNEQDFYPTRGTFDTNELQIFADAWSATTVYLVTTYEQSRNGDATDLTQATAANQPLLYNSGPKVGQRGTLAALFDGTSDYIATSTDLGHDQPITQMIVWESDSWVNGEPVTDADNGDSFVTLQMQAPTGYFRIYANSSLTNSQQIADDSLAYATMIFNNTSSEIKLQDNSRTGTAGNKNPDGLTVGAFGNGTAPAAIRFYEIIDWERVLTSRERGCVEFSQRIFYGRP